MFSLRALLPFLALGVSCPAVAGNDAQLIDQIIDQGKNHSQLMSRLYHVCKVLGPRLTGSPRLAGAEQWAAGEFKRFGLKNVHLEKWGETPVGWDRGRLQVAQMVEPFVSDIVFTTPAWTNGTQGIVKGEVVVAPMTVQEVEQQKAHLKGAWVLCPGAYSTRPAAAGTPSLSPEVKDALEAAGIAGRVYSSRNELVVTLGVWKDATYERHPGAPVVIVRKSDYERLARNVSFGRHTVLAIGAENKWYKGPVPQYNVVADIPGTEKPNEYVIVSGHFDSWNGPGSEGALDNGVGSMTAMEAARILSAVKAHPKRTIRFILWSGEEQGLYGSAAYVKLHPELLPKISAVLVDDGGTGYQAGYVGIESQKEIMDCAFAPVVKAFPNLPQKFVTQAHMAKGGGSDHASFNAVGVPGFFTIEGGNVDYTKVHHTQFDRYEEAVPEYLVQSATNHAVVAYNLANLPELLPREEPAPAK